MGPAQANASRPKCSRLSFRIPRSNPPAERGERGGNDAARHSGVRPYIDSPVHKYEYLEFNAFPDRQPD